MSATRYIVRRLSWTPSSYGGCVYVHDAGSDGVHSGVPVRAFADRAAADACCRELEAEARRQMPPGRVTVDGHLDEGDATAWCERVAALGLTPPALIPSPRGRLRDGFLDNATVLRWWAGYATTATPELQEAVWESLPGPRFYDVVEVPLVED